MDGHSPYRTSTPRTVNHVPEEKTLSNNKMTRLALLSQYAPEVVMFLYAVGNRLFYPPFSQEIANKVCLYELRFPPEICANLHLYRAEAERLRVAWAQWSVYQSVLQAGPFLVSTVLIAAWGDRFSRRWPLVLPPCGCIVEASVVLLAMQWHAYGSIWMMVAADVLYCFSGCWTTINTTVLLENI